MLFHPVKQTDDDRGQFDSEADDDLRGESMMDESRKNQVKQQFSRNADKYVTSAIHAKGEDLAWLVSCAKANANMNVLDIATGEDMWPMRLPRWFGM